MSFRIVAFVSAEFLSDYDIDKYTKGASKDLGLHSQTVQEISKEYAARRKQFKKIKLNWRKSEWR